MVIKSVAFANRVQWLQRHRAHVRRYEKQLGGCVLAGGDFGFTAHAASVFHQGFEFGRWRLSRGYGYVLACVSKISDDNRTASEKSDVRIK